MLVPPVSELVEGFREIDVSGVSILFTAWERTRMYPSYASMLTDTCLRILLVCICNRESC